MTVSASPSPFTTIIRLLLKWWWLIAIAVALGGGVGFFVRSKQPDVYYSTADVLFDQNFLTQKDNATLNGVQDTIDVFAGLARLPKTLLPVIKDLNLGVTIDDLNGRMDVHADPKLPFLHITVADTNAATAANIANRISTELINQSANTSTTGEISFRLSQLTEIQNYIVGLQNRLRQLDVEATTLTSSFDLQQNAAARESTSAALLQQRQLYADMSQGIEALQRQIITLYQPAEAETAITVRGSFASIVLSGVAGLVLSIGTIVLLGYFDDRLQWHEGLQYVNNVRVLGPLGLVPRNKLPLYTLTMPEAIESEVLRQLRAKIILAAGGIHPRILTVTSYDSGDGKTTTSANLALLSAQNDLRTLLIDGDIRKGNSHEMFNLPNVMGLSDILASRQPIPDLLNQVLLKTPHENLTLLPSGRSTADPASLLGGVRLGQLLSLLQDRFEVIIMDSVPTIGGPDAAFMAEASDGVLIVVHAQRTTQRALERTLSNLHQGRDANILGVAFNRIPLQLVSTYNRPYYRRDLAISQDRLSKDITNASAGKMSGLLPRVNPQVIKATDGELLYSIAAASVQLGVSQKTLKEWIGHGLLKIESFNRKEWLRQSEMQRLLDNLPRYQGGAFQDYNEPPQPVLSAPMSEMEEELPPAPNNRLREILAMATPTPEAQNGRSSNGNGLNGTSNGHSNGNGRHEDIEDDITSGTMPSPAVTIPDMLRGQREAILEFLRKPQEPDDDGG